MFEALFNGVSTRFGLRIVENSIENPHFIFCSSFQNLRLGSINLPLPNEDFGSPNQPFRMRFRSTFQGREYSIWETNR